MTGCCETCHWWQDEERDGEPVQRLSHPAPALTVSKVCVEGPIHLPTPPRHRCGRHRVREDLAGGVDERPQTWGKA